MTDATATRPEPVRTRFGLSGKLLVLTILFVMIAEVLIYVPSVANFRVVWLKDRLATAYTAALVLDAAPNGVVSDALAKQILDSIGARGVAMKMGSRHRMIAVDDMPPAVNDVYDMRNFRDFDVIVDAFKTMLNAREYVMRVVGPLPAATSDGEYVELVMDEQPLRKAMLRYSADILFLSLAISAITAALVYLALHYMFVRPMRRVTANMIKFRADPENTDRVIVPTGRLDEIGTAERELATMQTELASMLHQKSRLASLGLAVSKINHDLRNLLASAQLFSDRLATIPDPGVQRFAPKLMRALERAIAFCQSTLSYGGLQEPPPERREILLEPLVEEVHETLGLGPDAPIRWISAVERGLTVDADYDQLFRILLNLARNAVQAMAGQAMAGQAMAGQAMAGQAMAGQAMAGQAMAGQAMAGQAMESGANRDPGRDQIRITGRREGAVAVIEVSDTGPGFSEKARAHLFEAFQGSTRTGGAGLGLAIAAELVRAHGGEIRLVEGTIGATLRLTIPDRAVELAAHRGARAHG
jgi:pentapeptide MXKDX repeat protein